jgi:hypothetical protein
MKRKLYFFTSFLFLSALVGTNWKCNKENACDCIHGTGTIVQEERQLPVFHSVYVEDNVNLIFQEDTVQKILVQAGKQLIKLVKTEMRGDELYIHNDNKCNFSRRYDIPINVYIHYVRNQFYHVKSKATSFISNTNPCTSDSIDLDIESSGDINFKMGGTGAVFTHQHGAGDVTITGTCDQVIIYSIGTGFTTTDGCTNNYTWVYTTTTGIITVDPINQLNCEIAGSGNIYYKGSPPIISNSETNTGKLLPLH